MVEGKYVVMKVSKTRGNINVRADYAKKIKKNSHAIVICKNHVVFSRKMQNRNRFCP